MRLTINIIIITSILSLVNLCQLQAQAMDSVSIGKMNDKPINAFVMLIRLRYDLRAHLNEMGELPEDPKAKKALDGHSKYWGEKLKRGIMLIGGAMEGDYWDNEAIIVFEAPTMEKAKQLVANDPAVKAHVFEADVRPFILFSVSNKFAN